MKGVFPMVLYFTGTGNSRYAARKISEKLGDKLVSINEYIKKGEDGCFTDNRPWVFVAPTYAWQLPKIVEKFIRSSRFSGSREAYFILTCGASVGNAAEKIESLCREKGFTFQGLSAVVMPENYIAMFPVPTKEKARRIIEKANPIIDRLADSIREGRRFPSGKAGLLSRLESGPINGMFYRFQVSAKGFRVTESCVGCGKCAQLCPLNNIHLENEKPVWGSDCTHCMACISACPTQAIEYKKISAGKPRHYLK